MGIIHHLISLENERDIKFEYTGYHITIVKRETREVKHLFNFVISR